MSNQEQLETFRAVLLTAVNLFSETRKDTAKLKIQVLALKNSLSALDPAWNVLFQQSLVTAEKASAGKQSPAEIELEKVLGEVVHLLDPNENQEN